MSDEAQPTLSQPRRRSAMSFVRPVIALAVICGVLTMLFARVWAAIAPDVTPGLAVYAAFGSIVMIAFWWHAGVVMAMLALAAASARMRATAAAAALAAVFGLAPWISSLVPSSHSPAKEDPSLVVYSANLLHCTADPDIIAADLDRLDVDVLALQELHAPHLERYVAAFRDRLPHAEIYRTRGSFQAVLSRWPIVSRARASRRGVVIDWQGRRVRIKSIHLMTPISRSGVLAQDEQSRRLAAEAWDDTEMVILAGDFNAPRGTAVMRRLTRAGFSEVFDVSKAGVAGTWAPKPLLGRVPGIHIDHVLARGAGVRSLNAGLGAPNGSDHRAIWAEIAP